MYILLYYVVNKQIFRKSQRNSKKLKEICAKLYEKLAQGGEI